MTKLDLTEYAVHTDDPDFLTLGDFVDTHKLHYEMHLNRTRVLVPAGAILTEFLLRFPRAYVVSA